MKQHMLLSLLALVLALSMLLPTFAFAEEMGEFDLYASEVYTGEQAVEAPAPVDPAAEQAVYAVAAPEAFPATLTLGAKESWALNGLMLSDGQPVRYESSAPKLVTVDENGIVTAKKKGSAVVTCYLGDVPLAQCAVDVMKAPKKVTYPVKSLILGLGEWRAFPAGIPEGSAGTVSYASDNPVVLAVDEAGNIAGVGPGTANLIATAYNDKRATCAVQVLSGPSPTWVALSQSEAYMMAKGVLQLYAWYDEGSAAVLSYDTSNKKIATVDANGLVTGKKGGQAVITVTTHNGLTASCLVTVYTAPKKVSLNAKKLTLNVGEGAQLAASITANSVTEFTWSTDNAAVAAVDGNGYVTAAGAGKATVTVTTTNGKKAKCKVTVHGPVQPSAPKKVKLNAKKATLNAGEGYQLAAILPENSIPDVAWNSDNPAVATVDANGWVVAVGPGTATITVVTVNGKTAKCKVTVKGESAPATPTLPSVPNGRIEVIQFLHSNGEKTATVLGLHYVRESYRDEIDSINVFDDYGAGINQISIYSNNTKHCIEGIYPGIVYATMEQILLSKGYISSVKQYKTQSVTQYKKGNVTIGYSLRDNIIISVYAYYE